MRIEATQTLVGAGEVIPGQRHFLSFFTFISFPFFLIQIQARCDAWEVLECMRQAKDCPIFCVWRVF
jgi:hypothetical protein